MQIVTQKQTNLLRTLLFGRQPIIAWTSKGRIPDTNKQTVRGKLNTWLEYIIKKKKAEKVYPYPVCLTPSGVGKQNFSQKNILLKK